MKKIILILILALISVVSFGYKTRAEIIYTQNEIYKESIVIPKEYISIEGYNGDNAYSYNLSPNNIHNFTINLNNAIKIAKGLNPDFIDTFDTTSYKWTLTIKFNLHTWPTDYYEYELYGFEEFGHSEENRVFQTIYFEYAKIDGVVKHLGSTYADLGYMMLPNQFTFSTNFFTSNSGLNYNLEAVILTAESENNYIAANDNYELITDKITEDKPISITEKTLLYMQGNVWRFKAEAAGSIYYFDAAIPQEIYDHSEINIMSNNQFYAMVVKGNDNHKKLVLLIKNNIMDTSPIELNPIGNPKLESFENYHALNLSDGIFIRTAKLIINGIVSKESNYNAYLYANFPMEVEDLLSIRLSYSYRYTYLLSSGTWEKANNIYQKDVENEVQPPRWIWWFSLPFYTVPYQVVDAFNFYNVNQIQEATTIPEKVYDDYLQHLKISKQSVDSGSNFKIHLGQFRETTSVGYDIDNVVVLYLTYKEEGFIYDVPYELIEENIYVPELETPPLDKVGDFIDNIFPLDIFKEAQTALNTTLLLLSVLLSFVIVSRIVSVFTKRR